MPRSPAHFPARRCAVAVGLAALALLGACSQPAMLQVADGTGPKPQLPPPSTALIPTVNVAKAIGWPAGVLPEAAPGTRVNAFASQLDHPRWLYVLPNNDVLVAETNAPPKPDDGKGIKGWAMKFFMSRAGAVSPSANRITLLRDTNGDGVADLRVPFIEGLNSPFGMVLVGNDLYVANTDGLVRYGYRSGQTTADGPPTVLTALPGGPINHHWTKNVVASADGHKLYVSVGSNSNVAERGMAAEAERAAILEVDRQTGSHRVFASGLRNPVGMAWEPVGGRLWTVVNERDELGSDLVPDYLTSVQDGGFYGWPYSYFGQHVDTRVQPPQPELVARALVPDYALGPHTASLGLANASGNRLPTAFARGMFVGQHGSWNREPRSGYKVVFVPFDGAKPSGPPLDVLTGFLNAQGQAMGRPVGVAVDRQGALLVADDVGNAIWRVSAP
ncbi:MAG: sorbosone dehydrogenase family protein [Pseudomonadota bacterium]